MENNSKRWFPSVVSSLIDELAYIQVMQQNYLLWGKKVTDVDIERWKKEYLESKK